jgi:hypothetical protein
MKPTLAARAANLAAAIAALKASDFTLPEATRSSDVRSVFYSLGPFFLVYP